MALRVAPSPTGDMHIGTARTAYFNWLAARATGQDFILRIDDTDRERNKKEAVDVILKTMDWLGLDYDELVYQSDRIERYKECARGLVESNKAYYDGECIRMHLPSKLMPDAWTDSICGSVPITDTSLRQCGHMVLIKSDGMPTYHFATVVDDVDFDVSWIIRGDDHKANTAKHVAIYMQLRMPHPKYSHVGLIMKDKKKISKRDEAASMLKYQEAGIHPEAMLNFLLRMGWGPKVDDKTTAIIDRDTAIKLFVDGGSMKASPASYDEAKLLSFDRKYKARDAARKPQLKNIPAATVIPTQHTVH